MRIKPAHYTAILIRDGGTGQAIDLKYAFVYPDDAASQAEYVARHRYPGEDIEIAVLHIFTRECVRNRRVRK